MQPAQEPYVCSGLCTRESRCERGAWAWGPRDQAGPPWLQLLGAHFSVPFTDFTWQGIPRDLPNWALMGSLFFLSPAGSSDSSGPRRPKKPKMAAAGLLPLPAGPQVSGPQSLIGGLPEAPSVPRQSGSVSRVTGPTCQTWTYSKPGRSRSR